MEYRELLIWFLCLIPLVWISKRSLIQSNHRGIYRLASWSGVSWLIICNLKFWYKNPFSINQGFSWALLTCSLYLLLSGLLGLRKGQQRKANRDDPTLFSFEKTTSLVHRGIFRYIRHPLYSSLLFLTWGVYLKHLTIGLTIVSLLTSLSLFLTAKAEEQENIGYFGKRYRKYMEGTRRFIPFLF